ncbi:MAG: IctB family putative bicarbonate transporter [Kaiparowitsia implicata GSE-PSE-MK54-09C]|jgi:putative inorganic carbon (HCO3(-)) transporter|nr:IctB family putative bicarbonate transporter [Kaiparowitsia implicata GSE-PSE-MK54-09C]
MNSVWQQLTFATVPVQQWVKTSYLHRLVGSLQRWRQGSWLMQWGEPLGALLVALVLVLAPYVSTALIGILMVACGAFWLLLTLSDDDTPGITPIHLLVLLYTLVSLVSVGMSPVKMAAADGFIKLALNVALFFLMARVLRSPRLRSTVITLYLLTTTVVSAYGLRQWFFGAQALATWVDAQSTLVGTTRVYSYLGNPNLLAGYLIPACMFSAAAVFVWKRWLPKALAVVLTLLNSACLVLTFSRGGWLGYVAGSFVFLLLLVHWLSQYLPGLWRRWAMPLVLGVSVALVCGAVMTVAPLRDRVFSMFAGRADSSNNFRLNVWAAVQDMIRDRPILGIGPGNTAFNRIYPQYQRTGYTALSAYSVVLEILVETGVIGFTCFLWLLTVTLSQGLQQLQALRRQRLWDGFWLVAAIAAIAGMLTHGLVDTVWYRPQISTLWWLMLALIASYYPYKAGSRFRASGLPPNP